MLCSIGGSTAHFNHSLWTGEEGSETNVIFDPNSEDNFSQIGSHSRFSFYIFFLLWSVTYRVAMEHDTVHSIDSFFVWHQFVKTRLKVPGGNCGFAETRALDIASVRDSKTKHAFRGDPALSTAPPPRNNDHNKFLPQRDSSAVLA